MSTGLVDRYGTPGGPLVIALHGAVANRKTWLPLARALPATIDLWCPDLPGHGGRRAEAFTLAESLRTVDAMLADSAAGRAFVVGDSLGGYLALAAAERLGSRVAGVVAGGCTWSMRGVAGALARASDVPVRILAGLAGSERCERWIEGLVSRVARPGDAAAIVEAGVRLRARSESLVALRDVDLEGIVRALRIPIAFVNGAFDWPTRAGERALTSAARDAESIVVPGVGHGVGLLAPDAFARAITRTIARAST